jgi:hypothetical protein
MQIALTKKLAEAAGITPETAAEPVNPLFSWTANFTNTFSDRKEDMVVLVNNATRFTVVLYGIKRRQFKGFAQKVEAAIRHTLEFMNVNPAIIDAYMEQSGATIFTSNKDRKLTAILNTQCTTAARYVGNFIRHRMSLDTLKYTDTFGAKISRLPLYINNGADLFEPHKKFLDELAKLTDKPIYDYRAYELLITLDVGVYKAKRRIIVPANIEMQYFHRIIQNVFDWSGYHLYCFSFMNSKKDNPYAPALRLLAFEDDLDQEDDVLMDGHSLDEFMEKYKYAAYVYDFGDDWIHDIALIREIKHYNEESPRLVKATGQTPPEDVGGPYGYEDFYRIITNPEDPEYDRLTEWAGSWTPELPEWNSKPGVLDVM